MLDRMVALEPMVTLERMVNRVSKDLLGLVAPLGLSGLQDLKVIQGPLAQLVTLVTQEHLVCQEQLD